MLKPVLFVTAAALAAAFFLPDLAGRLLVARPSAPPPAPPSANVATTPVTISTATRIALDARGHYSSEVRINGRAFGAIIDTGATLVTLRYEDARALGLVLPGDKFDVVVRTANGEGRGRYVTLRSVRIGSITINEVDAMVAEQGALGTNLLGMSFLRRLSRYEVRSGTMVLER